MTWTYETIVDADPAERLNALLRAECTVEVLLVLPSGPEREHGGLLIRYSEAEPRLPRG